MSEPLGRLRRFLRELKRRNVYKVAVAYLAVAFVGLQAAQLLVPPTTLPGWADDFLIYVAVFGFPIALVIAWAFEMTPEGMRRTPEAEPEEGEAAQSSTGLQAGYKVLVGLGLVAGAVAGGWYLTGGGGENPEISDRSVAVLPFETLGDTASSTFTEGLHTDLLTRLQRISDLTVIARPSVTRYGETEKPLPEVARDLGARWIVTAAVQRAGDQVQVQPRLVDPRTGTERWSDSYRRKLTAESLFAVQTEITREIADALEAQLSSGEQERVAERPTQDLDAYQLYAEGRHQLARRSTLADEHVQKALHLFRRAIEQDSSFALAWSGLADAAADYESAVADTNLAPLAWSGIADAAIARWSGKPDTVTAPGVSQEFAARRALELNPDLAEAHASIGYLHYQNNNAPAALRQLRRAVELKPSYWEAHNRLGWLYVILDRPEGALEHFKLAVELNPQHAWARHGLYDAYNWAGQPKKSLREARRQKRLGLEHRDAVGGEVRALMSLGRLNEARQLAEEQVAKLGVDRVWGRWFRVYLIDILTRQGDSAQAQDYLEQLRTADVPLVYISDAYRRLGEPDRALEALAGVDEDFWGSWLSMVLIRVLGDQYPWVQDDSRYQELLREANRYWGLNPDGSLPDSVDVSFGSDSDE